MLTKERVLALEQVETTCGVVWEEQLLLLSVLDT